MRVLVTRPEPEASLAAARLERLGHEPVVLPLTEIRGLAVPGEIVAADFDAVAITSANATRHAPQGLLGAAAGLRCFAVGESTAGAARQAGFADVVEGPGDAAGLADIILSAVPRPGRLLYLTGRAHSPAFERALGEQGMRVSAIETYDTVAAVHEPGGVQHRLEVAPMDAVLLYSASASEAYGHLAQAPGLTRHIGKARLLCISGRVASALGPTMRQYAEVAARPTEAALFEMLRATV